MANRKIVKIKRSTKYSDRIIVYLDDKSVFRIPEDVFVLNPLQVDDEVSIETIESYGKKMRLQEAKDAGYRLLGFRMRSIAEMRKRLKEKDFIEDGIDYVVNQMIDLKYLDDNAFGKAFVREKVKNKKIGPMALRSDLIPHFLPSDLVDRLIRDIYTEFDPHELIAAHLKKRGIKREEPLDQKSQKRMNDFLARKGFYWDSIREVYLEWGLI